MMKRKIRFAAAALMTVCAVSITAQAGGINAAESSVISAASGMFEYKGKTYVAKPEYLSQVTAKLSEDGVDLTEEQASSLISQMNASVGEGVAQGYLMEVGSSKEEPKPKDNGKLELKEGETGSGTADPGSQGNTDSQSEDGAFADSIDNTIETDSEAEYYMGYNIKAINEKKPEERSEEEEGAYQEYIAEKAAERLVESGIEEASGGEKAKEEKLYPELWKIGGISAAFLIICILAVLFIRNRIRKARGSKIFKSLNGGLIDIHSHILYGVDDGAADEDASLKIIEKAYEQGVRKMFATPHYIIGHNRVPAWGLKETFAKLQETVRERFKDMELYLGSELLYRDGVIEKLNQGRVLTMSDSRYVLVEYRADESYSYILTSIIQLQRHRYRPIIAHVERYQSVMRDRKHLEELRSAGALLQMNCGSVRRYMKYIKTGLIDFLATDSHDPDRRSPNMEKAAKEICASCGEAVCRRLLIENGRLLIKDNEQ
ncbi:MAG: CpsB/CapC family capsule biosynthesis tyrosine phosphatase [Lachnospiraceae bacterium]|jgi:protein-tyrosine phosphatase|nr:CpsB/CapC family capsule biosynthesis tyrosine phosphatase [Lachnospiraceae bacterium]